MTDLEKTVAHNIEAVKAYVARNDLAQKVADSIEAIKSFNNIASRKGGYYLAFSGGKDSVVCKRLLDMAGVKYDAHYTVTSVDPPELMQFIKEKYSDVEREIPHSASGRPETMWNLIKQKLMPPTRLTRYCCEKLKESGGDDRFAVTGVRKAESVNRAKNAEKVMIKKPDRIAKRGIAALSPNIFSPSKSGFVLMNDNDEARRLMEQCVRRNKIVLNPIIDWTDAEVWEFIKAENIPYCGLYDEGFHRLGCIGCPMAQKHGREREFARWPEYKKLYLLAFDKMLEERKRRGKITERWHTAEDVYNWWMEYDELPGQIDLLEDYEIEDDDE